MTPRDRIRRHLCFLYGEQTGAQMWARLQPVLDDFKQHYPQLSADQRSLSARLSQSDAILITYGDQVQEPERSPLQSLAEFSAAYLQGVVSAIHILPFYPYSSDDGFSVIDYRQVNPDFGTWQDVAILNQNFRLMFDGVINHISQHSEWFQSYLKNQEPYTGYFITVDPDTDLTMVVRPRALPLLTRVETTDGPQWVWTTFSEDQIDLNYASPDLMQEIIDLFLFYIEQGAEIVRLDAIAYLWKELGTSCIHLPQTHEVVRLLRAMLDDVAPGVILITETNVPHEENISYFGQAMPSGGTDEAQLVYQFSLSPLIMHSVLTGDASVLSQWAASLGGLSGEVTFFNFTASHDGVGVRPAEGLLTPEQIQHLADTTISHGGRVSYKTNSDGSQSAYELNISYFDALSDPKSNEPVETKVARFMVSQSIMSAMAGVPGIYVHSLFGSQSWFEGMELTGRNRTINRQKFDRAQLTAELSDPASLRSQVFTAYNRLLQARASESAFHPFAQQRVLDLGTSVFALLRCSLEGKSQVLCLHNVSDHPHTVVCRAQDLDFSSWRDMLSDDGGVITGDEWTIELAPYAVRWIKLDGVKSA